MKNISRDLAFLSRLIKSHTIGKTAMLSFSVDSKTEGSIVSSSFDWKSRHGMKSFITPREYSFSRDEVIVDPVGNLTDPELKDMPFVKSLRRDGMYAFILSPGTIFLVSQRYVKSD